MIRTLYHLGVLALLLAACSALAASAVHVLNFLRPGIDVETGVHKRRHIGSLFVSGAYFGSAVGIATWMHWLPGWATAVCFAVVSTTFPLALFSALHSRSQR